MDLYPWRSKSCLAILNFEIRRLLIRRSGRLCSLVSNLASLSIRDSESKVAIIGVGPPQAYFYFIIAHFCCISRYSLASLALKNLPSFESKSIYGCPKIWFITWNIFRTWDKWKVFLFLKTQSGMAICNSIPAPDCPLHGPICWKSD